MDRWTRWRLADWLAALHDSTKRRARTRRLAMARRLAFGRFSIDLFQLRSWYDFSKGIYSSYAYHSAGRHLRPPLATVLYRRTSCMSRRLPRLPHPRAINPSPSRNTLNTSPAPIDRPRPKCRRCWPGPACGWRRRPLRAPLPASSGPGASSAPGGRTRRWALRRPGGSSRCGGTAGRTWRWTPPPSA